MMPDPLRPQLIALEKRLVIQALIATGGDVREAACLLEMPWRTLYRRLERPLGIDLSDFRRGVSQTEGQIVKNDNL